MKLKKLLSVLLAMVLLLTCIPLTGLSVGAASRASTFENGTTDGWKASGSASKLSVVSGGASGRYALKLIGQDYGLIWKYVDVTPNENLKISFKMKTDLAISYPLLRVRLSSIDWTTTLSEVRISTSASTSWKEYSVTLNPGNNSKVLLFFQLNYSAGPTLWFDDIAFEGNTATGATPEYPPDSSPAVNIKQQIGDLDLGPYELKGATIEVLGKEISLINLQAKLKLEIGDHIKIEVGNDGTVKALIGFDENAKANIDGANNSSTYWSQSYNEVKSMYQQLTGKKVSTTKLWNRFETMRSKLKKINGSLVVGVETQMMAFMEFKPVNGQYTLMEAGALVSFEANANLRSYYGPVYVALGIGVGAEGNFVFTKVQNKYCPQITMEPKLTLSVGAGVGGRKTYAEISAYGTLHTIISTNSSTPLKAGLDLGVQGKAYLLGNELLEIKKSFKQVQLYPDMGGAWPAMLMMSDESVDVATKSSYEDFINAGEPLSRDYLQAAYSLKRAVSYNGASFVKDNSYLLNAPQIVSFDDGSMLLMWIDDTGEKTSSNLGSLMYSFYNGVNWSDPAVLFEDGTYSDIPAICSDGTKAYFVWQKANIIFDEGVQTSDMLPNFDLYFASFDSATQSFTDIICVTPEEDTTFEFLPTIDVSNGVVSVAWAENTDNNVYQMSGINTIKMVNINNNSELGDKKQLISSENTVSDMDLIGGFVYYTLLTGENNALYRYANGQTTLVCDYVTAFDCENEKVFYSTENGFYKLDGDSLIVYDSVGSLQNFTVESNGEEYVLFTEQVNEDYSKTLYYSRLAIDENQWSALEVYTDRGKFIKDYEPVMLPDGKVYVAVNYTNDGDVQSGALVVERCTEAVDVSLSYVDFDEAKLSEETIDLMLGVDNNSSTEFDRFTLQVTDEDGNIIDSQVVTGALSAFGSAKLTTQFDMPENASQKTYTFALYPVDYVDLKEDNNIVMSTFECIHLLPEELLIESEATDLSSAHMYYICDRCDTYVDYYSCGENLMHSYDNACDLSCDDCGDVRVSSPSQESLFEKNVYHSVTAEEETGSGLAFRFAMNMCDVDYDGNQYISGTGTVLLDGKKHTLKKMGAIVSNDFEAKMDLNHLDEKTVNIETNYLLAAEEQTVSFAVRIINIPDFGESIVVRARPYYIYECDGVEVVVYGDMDATTYQQELDKVNT